MKMNFIPIIVKIILLLCLCGHFGSCKKFVEVPIPNNALTGPAVFINDATATAAVNGLYINMTESRSIQGLTGISILTGLSSDELTLFSNNTGLTDFYYQNNLSGQLPSHPWSDYFSYIQTINAVLEGLSKSNTLSQSVKKQLDGEVKFLRAFFYFYLVNYYGDVPLILTTDWKVNALLFRASKSQVWQQIINDLKEAQSLLSDKYLTGDAKTVYTSGSEERVRPSKWAATALLARTYLYNAKYDSAELEATKVISNTALFDTVALNNVFLKNSKEAIWQLMSVNPLFSTIEAPTFIITATGFNNSRPAFMSTTLLNGFEANDKRRLDGNWVKRITISGTTYHFPFKYKVRNLIANPTPTEYFTILRLGEQYLIRAEARAQLGNVAGAKVDLFQIRRRAGLADSTLTANDQTSLLNAILHERQVELFCESGHRWFDLKRTGQIDAVMTSITPLKANGSQWQSFKQYWPIYIRDIQVNPNLTQSPGY